MGVIVAVDDQPDAELAGTLLGEVADVGPIGGRCVDEDSWENKRIGVAVFLVDELQLAVVLVDGPDLRHLL